MSEIDFVHAKKVIIWYNDLDKEIYVFVADKWKTFPLNSSFWILDLQTICQNVIGCHILRKGTVCMKNMWGSRTEESKTVI